MIPTFSPNNLQLAWRRTLTNRDPFFKSYFRHIYRAYSLSAIANLTDLRERLIQGHFTPTNAIKIYLPKSSGALRPYTLLNVEDQIVYQAMVNIVADKLYPRVRKNYNKTVFGNLYSGPTKIFFFRDWHGSYARFSKAIREAFADGNDFTAAFDLTACFDSIDHTVLRYFLRDLGLDDEFGNRLCRFLSHWSATTTKPIYQGHGIPQGPQPSGLLAECVLRYFDDSVPSSHSMRYFRYVDDIRLFASSEKALRKQLMDLEMRSKEIGLFPQSSKINIHRVKNIDDEIKEVSHPPDPVFLKPEPDQLQLRRRLIELTPRFTVPDETKFKYLLARALPNAQLTSRLLKIAHRSPHLYNSVFNYLSKAQTLSKAVSIQSLALLSQDQLYSTYTAAFVRALTGRVHPLCEQKFLNYCHLLLFGNPSIKDCEGRAAFGCALLKSSSMTWTELSALIKQAEWWDATQLIKCVRTETYGIPSYEALLNEALHDSVVDLALVAAELITVEGLAIHKPIKQINKIAQLSLRASGLIGRVQSGRCLVCEAIREVFGSSAGNIQWKRVLGSNYRAVGKKIAPWRGYAISDPTAWVNMTDTINDLLLDSLFRHDHTIGAYTLGQIGSVLTPGNRLSVNYPKFFRAVSEVHHKRLESDLSHPVTRATQKLTKRIRYNEMEGLKNRLREGYLELWKRW
jgi:retron-type reverse transcriptase